MCRGLPEMLGIEQGASHLPFSHLFPASFLLFGLRGLTHRLCFPGGTFASKFTADFNKWKLRGSLEGEGREKPEWTCSPALWGPPLSSPPPFVLPGPGSIFLTFAWSVWPSHSS